MSYLIQQDAKIGSFGRHGTSISSTVTVLTGWQCIDFGKEKPVHFDHVCLERGFHPLIKRPGQIKLRIGPNRLPSSTSTETEEKPAHFGSLFGEQFPKRPREKELYTVGKTQDLAGSLQALRQPVSRCYVL